MWKLIFSSADWPLIDDFLEFVELNCKNAVSKDTWTQLLTFMKTIKKDLSNFDDGTSLKLTHLFAAIFCTCIEY